MSEKAREFPDVPRLVFRFLASNGLATVLILFLFLLTLLGTLEQQDRGIAEVQAEYFESLFLLYEGFLPLPGVYLLLILLTLNIVVGAIVNVRWRPARIGVLITHIGMVLLFASGFLIYQLAERGELELGQGQQSDQAVAERAWEIAVFPADAPGSYTEHIIPEGDFAHLDDEDSRSFFAKTLPFEIELSRFWKNPAGSRAKVDALVLAGESSEPVELTLSGGMGRPRVIETPGGSYALWLRKKRIQLPFTMQLESFRATFYPGTETPKDFRSEVVLYDEKGEKIQQAEIYMNHPLRRGGFTFYQSRYRGSTSIFEVVQNPADPYPLYSTIIVSIGLLIHFLRKLFRYLLVQSARRS